MDHVRCEYSDVSANIRHYANMRFAQLTLFAAMTAGLLTILFSSSFYVESPLRALLMIGGAVTAGIFWVMEERATDHWHHFNARAIELEKSLGYLQYTDRQSRKVLNATNAVRTLYGTAILFWLAALVYSCASCGCQRNGVHI